MFNWFEKRIAPYPDAPPPVLPNQFFAFIWQATKGTRGLLLGLMLLTAVIGIFEALLFAMMGKLVDWLSHVSPALLWQQEGWKLAALALVIV